MAPSKRTSFSAAQASAVSLAWAALNDVLRAADETRCVDLLFREQQGPKRPAFLKRIHSRLNRVRAARERAELRGEDDPC